MLNSGKQNKTKQNHKTRAYVLKALSSRTDGLLSLPAAPQPQIAGALQAGYFKGFQWRHTVRRGPNVAGPKHPGLCHFHPAGQNFWRSSAISSGGEAGAFRLSDRAPRQAPGGPRGERVAVPSPRRGPPDAPLDGGLSPPEKSPAATAIRTRSPATKHTFSFSVGSGGVWLPPKTQAWKTLHGVRVIPIFAMRNTCSNHMAGAGTAFAQL